MTQTTLTILENTKIAESVYRLTLAGDTSAITAAGQFVNLKLSGFYLRRPISVCDWEEETLTLIYKIQGRGTQALSEMAAGQTLNALVGLGNGYNTDKSGTHALLVGGGVGIPPLYGLAKRLIADGKRVTAVLGFNRAQEVFLTEEFRSLGAQVILMSADGSCGQKGLVTDGMKAVEACTYLYTCGPEPMLRAVYAACKTPGQFSFEERMGCGFGACMGCTCRTKYGTKRICKDGPVLEKEEIIW